MSAQPKLAPRDEAPAPDASATETAATQPEAAKTLVTQRPDAGPALAQMIHDAAVRHGKSPVQLLTEFARLAIGPGRLSIEEYFAFGLYDDKALAGVDKTHFAGLRAMRDVWCAINWDDTWDGLLCDKLSLEVLFRGLGLPTTTTIALFSAQRTAPALRVMRDAPELQAFLREGANYPLFGKPTDSIQSLGSTSFTGYDASSDELIGTQGGRVGVAAFAAEVADSYSAGYLFQRRISPHASVQALVGERLSTVRVMTVMTKSGPEILRTLWKIPAGSNVADNFWRPGNMLGQLDREHGRIVRVVAGVGINAREVEVHPDTGARLIGAEVPDWQKVLKLALDGAGVLSKVPLIGWDIGLGKHGPLIVEPNNSPDFGLPQIADRRGMLDERMKALIAERKAEKKAFKEQIKARVKQELRDERRRINRGLWS
jgi:hypothetical protein